MIGELIGDTTEDWRTNIPEINDLLSLGWGFGGHGWTNGSSTCNQGEALSFYMDQTTQVWDKLMTVVANSDRPDYKIISFAAPCFVADYATVIQSLKGGAETTYQFNESGNNYLMRVDSGANNFTANGNTAVKFDFSMDIGRATDLGVATSQVDWMAANADTSHHFWFNTLSHGNSEDDLSPIVDHIFNNYGAEGSNEAWVAPSDEIYSYLLEREKSTLSEAVVRAAVNNPPNISNKTMIVEQNKVTVNWLTDKESNSVVAYGLTEGLGSTIRSTELTNTHSLIINNLAACTKYYYQLSATDTMANKGMSTIESFISKGCLGEAAVLKVGETILPQSGGSMTLRDGDKTLIQLEVGDNLFSSETYFQVKQMERMEYLVRQLGRLGSV